MSPTILPIRIENEIEKKIEDSIKEQGLRRAVRDINSVRHRMRELYAITGKVFDIEYIDPVLVYSKETAIEALSKGMTIFATCLHDDKKWLVRAFQDQILLREIVDAAFIFGDIKAIPYEGPEQVADACEKLQPEWTLWGSGL
jgi:hypothetical protein